jgi:hypothetical protein
MTYTIIAQIETATAKIRPPAVKGVTETEVAGHRETFRAMARENIGSTLHLSVDPEN